MDICFRDACSGVKSREAFIIGLPGGQRPVKIYICPCRKKTKLRTELSGVACPIPPSMEPISAERGRVISGRQGENRIESLFGTNTKLLHGVFGPTSTPNDYLNTVLDDVVSLPGSCRNKQPSHCPHGKIFNLLQFSPCV